jgi:hypothetical protein
MPLLDHFNAPLNRTHPWRSFHGAWAAAIARLLNQGILPEGYYAVPLIDRDGPVEIDVQPWSAPAPSLAVAVELPPSDEVQVHVFADDGDPRLIAAIELVSPRNKDRPQSRQTFAAKCVSYLQHGSSVVVVDTVTTKRANLHDEILSLLAEDTESAIPSSLSAAAYRVVELPDETQQLSIWSASLGLGESLPTLPLWIAADYAVPLDLEASYSATCADLRIRQAG